MWTRTRISTYRQQILNYAGHTEPRQCLRTVACGSFTLPGGRGGGGAGRGGGEGGQLFSAGGANRIKAVGLSILLHTYKYSLLSTLLSQVGQVEEECIQAARQCK